uniref:Uncharacterized protein AlNc14C273G9995 n=1 Tax=Albugo laibachii Nc14 TaxID=890382 RepID=F0WUI4_9STRA|nr:conserved hypothetical protein [Albugo laibachii Nc14]|eukprot:CCA25065.1 conserved hypothetical protein [Albugo laibachii Nc14]
MRLPHASFSFICCFGVALRVFFFANTKWQIALSQRPELVTSISSFDRVKESVFHLQQGKSPYDGDTFHQPPLLLLAFYPLLTILSNHETITYTIIAMTFILLDIIIAFQLAKLTHWIHQFGEESRMQTTKDEPIWIEEEFPLSPLLKSAVLPNTVAAVYLLNPYSVASCVAVSTVSVTHAVIISSFVSATKKAVLTSCMLLALATYLSLYSAVLIFPIALYLKAVATQNGPSDRKLHSTSKLMLGFMISLAALLFLSYRLTQSWAFIEKTYGWIATYSDLTPNVGVFWYFFIEVFDRFVPYFLLLLHAHPLIYVVPLYLRLCQRPQAYACTLLGIMTLFQAYPTFGDFGFYMSLTMIHPKTVMNVRHRFVYLLGLSAATCVLPIMWHLWLYPASGNANFYFSQTLVYQVFVAQIIVAFVHSTMERDKRIQQFRKLKIDKCE